MFLAHWELPWCLPYLGVWTAVEWTPHLGDTGEVEAMSTARITIPLDIPDVQVLQTQITEQGEFIITVESRLSSARCRRCGRELRKLHGYDAWVTVRHLPILGRPVDLRYRPQRYRCDTCEGKPTTTQQVSWHEPNSPQTTAYDPHLLLQVVNAPVEEVRIKERLPYDVVLGVIERRIATQVDWTQSAELAVLGLDEIALKKGHRDFVVIVTARLAAGRIAILGVLPDRDKTTVTQFLKRIPAAWRATIHTLCTAMYDNYIQAARDALPAVRIVMDRFPVAQKYRDAADRVRKQELKRLKHELPKAEYQQLKGSLAAFRKNQAELRPDQHALLERLWTYTPLLKTVYTWREELTAIFNTAASPATAQDQLRAWQTRVRDSGLTCFDDFLNTLHHWWTEITNYFVNRDSSGFVEGLNNKLKVLKRRCYGLFNLGHLFQRIFLDLEGYRLFA